jgi:hypothetical protein
MKMLIACMGLLVFLPIYSNQPDIEDLYEYQINRGRIMEYAKDHPLQICVMAALGVYIPLSLICIVHQYYKISFYEDLIDVKLKKIENFYKIIKPYVPLLKQVTK